MDKDLEELRKTLRSLVVSSPTPVDVRTLTRDYRTLVGESLPFSRFGYRDCLTLLRERCSDCFLFEGSAVNPILTLIVPDSLKHIDRLVSKQRLGPKDKIKGKRWSVQEMRKPQPRSSAPRAPPTPAPPPPRAQPAHAQPPPEDSFGGPKLHSYNGRRGRGPDSAHSAEDVCKQTTKSRDTDSGRMTLSSGGRSDAGERRAQLDELALQLLELLVPHADGIWATDLMRLYREKFGRELHVERYGASSMTAFVRLLEGAAFHVRRPVPLGDWRLYNARAPLPPEPVVPPPASRSASPVEARAATPSAAAPAPAPDATPMDFLNSIAPSTTADIESGQMIDVVVGEVYSPSHFWLLRHDNDHIVPLYATMDAMTHYYEGEAAQLTLAAETEVRVGVYCAALYEGDWHRAVVVRMLEDDAVSVRYVDYGTVGRAKVRDLKPLSLRWSKLPEQAMRARLAGLRPPSRNPHWPLSSSHKFLELVHERRLVADVVAVDHEKDILEVYLVDTSTEEDVCINEQLLQKCFADERRDSALGDTAGYLRPTFEALESGATPNYAEVASLLANDISLYCIDDYRRHVLQEPAPAPAPAPAPPLPLHMALVHCQTFLRLMGHKDTDGALIHAVAAISHCPPAEPKVSLAPSHWSVFQQLLEECKPEEAAAYLEQLLRYTLGLQPHPHPHPHADSHTRVPQYWLDPATVAPPPGLGHPGPRRG